MTDLLRLKHLAFVREYEEDGAVIIEAKSRETKLPPPCCLLRSLDKNGTKRQRYRDHAVQSRTAWVEASQRA